MSAFSSRNSVVAATQSMSQSSRSERAFINFVDCRDIVLKGNAHYHLLSLLVFVRAEKMAKPAVVGGFRRGDFIASGTYGVVFKAHEEKVCSWWCAQLIDFLGSFTMAS